MLIYKILSTISKKSSGLWYTHIAKLGLCFAIVLYAPKIKSFSPPSISILMKVGLKFKLSKVFTTILSLPFLSILEVSFDEWKLTNLLFWSLGNCFMILNHSPLIIPPSLGAGSCEYWPE